MAECGCSLFPNGVPAIFKVTFAGFSNGTCGSCASFNADFLLTRVSTAGACTWELTLGSAICGISQLRLTIGQVGTSFKMTVATVGSGFSFSKTGILSAFEDSYALTSDGPAPLCSLGSATCTVRPQSFDKNSTDLSKMACMPTMQGGMSPPGTVRNLYQLPSLADNPLLFIAYDKNPSTAEAAGVYPYGATALSSSVGAPSYRTWGPASSGGSCAVPQGSGCGCGPSGGGSPSSPRGRLNPPTNTLAGVDDAAQSGGMLYAPGGDYATGGATSSTGSSMGCLPCPAPASNIPSVNQSMATLSRAIQVADDVAARTWSSGNGCSLQSGVNLSNGNLATRFSLPGAGPVAPRIEFTHNGTNGAASEFGYGWSCSVKPTVTTGGMGAPVTVTTGDGAKAAYWNMDASSNYQPPAGVNAALKLVSGAYTQTMPDGTKFNFSSSGAPQSIVNPSGGRWMSIVT